VPVTSDNHLASNTPINNNIYPTRLALALLVAHEMHHPVSTIAQISVLPLQVLCDCIRVDEPSHSSRLVDKVMSERER
jgi:hypothetical protein